MPKFHARRQAQALSCPSEKESRVRRICGTPQHGTIYPPRQSKERKVPLEEQLSVATISFKRSSPRTTRGRQGRRGTRMSARVEASCTPEREVPYRLQAGPRRTT